MRPANLNLVNVRQGETDKIPFDYKSVTFILVTNEEVRTSKTLEEKLEILDNIKSDYLLLAAWSGEYNTEIFHLNVIQLKQTELYKHLKTALVKLRTQNLNLADYGR